MCDSAVRAGEREMLVEVKSGWCMCVCALDPRLLQATPPSCSCLSVSLSCKEVTSG